FPALLLLKFLPADVELSQYECFQALSAENYEEACRSCERAFILSGKPDFGIAAARSLYSVRQFAYAEPLARKLMHGSSEAAALQILGSIHARTGVTSQARQELTRALDLHRRAGDHREAARDALQLAGSYEAEMDVRAMVTALETTAREAVLGGEARMSAFSWLVLGRLFRQVGDADTAEWALGRAEDEYSPEEAGERATVRFERAAALREQGLIATSSEL